MTVKTTQLSGWTKMSLLGIGLITAVGITASSCDKQTEPYKDAPRSYNDSGYSMDVVQGADGFSNTGSTCDGRGNRVFVVYHGDSLYGSVDVVPYVDLKPDDPCRALSGGGKQNAGGQ
jgi:hypothetical protein